MSLLYLSYGLSCISYLPNALLSFKSVYFVLWILNIRRLLDYMFNDLRIISLVNALFPFIFLDSCKMHIL